MDLATHNRSIIASKAVSATRRAAIIAPTLDASARILRRAGAPTLDAARTAAHWLRAGQDLMAAQGAPWLAGI